MSKKYAAKVLAVIVRQLEKAIFMVCLFPGLDRFYIYAKLQNWPPSLPTVQYTEHTELQPTVAFWRTFSHEGKICPGW